MSGLLVTYHYTFIKYVFQTLYFISILQLFISQVQTNGEPEEYQCSIHAGSLIVSYGVTDQWRAHFGMVYILTI